MANLNAAIQAMRAAKIPEDVIQRKLQERGLAVSSIGDQNMSMPKTMNPLLSPATNPNYIDPRAKMNPLEYLQKVPGVFMGSATQNLGDIANVVTNPKQTLEGFGNLIGSTVDIVRPGKQEGEGEALKALKEYYIEQYGSKENFDRKMNNDPIGVLSDLSMFLTGGATAVKGASKVLNIAGATSKAGKVSKVASILDTASNVVDPLSMATKGIRAGTGKVMGDVPGKLVERYIKPTTKSMQEKEILKVLEGTGDSLGTKIAKETKIPFTKATFAKKSISMIKDLENELDINLKNPEIADRLIPTSNITSKLDELRQIYTDVGDKSAIKKLDSIIDSTKASGNVGPISTIGGDTETFLTVAEANRIRKNTDKFLTDVFEQGKGPGTASAEKSLLTQKANAIRNEISKVAPEIAETNSKLSTWYKTRDSLVSMVREGKKAFITPFDVMFIMGGVAGGAAGGGVPGAIAGGVGGLALRKAIASPSVFLSTARSLQEMGPTLEKLFGKSKSAKALKALRMTDRPVDRANERK